LIGDIPFAGALFRSQSDQHIKRNLVIFVTVNLMDPAGQPMAQMKQEAMASEEMAMDSAMMSSVEPPLPQ
jgi:general secretion pathway protein D